mmetsp:Transcript_47785/g.84130  ORF Transcript_47785/g.84130 Transcript_47785/m.84130 type:complete len:226 (+) Transcript_47785:649-1326(+)
MPFIPTGKKRTAVSSCLDVDGHLWPVMVRNGLVMFLAAPGVSAPKRCCTSPTTTLRHYVENSLAEESRLCQHCQLSSEFRSVPDDLCNFSLELRIRLMTCVALQLHRFQTIKYLTDILRLSVEHRIACSECTREEGRRHGITIFRAHIGNSSRARGCGTHACRTARFAAASGGSDCASVSGTVAVASSTGQGTHNLLLVPKARRAQRWLGRWEWQTAQPTRAIEA